MTDYRLTVRSLEVAGLDRSQALEAECLHWSRLVLDLPADVDLTPVEFAERMMLWWGARTKENP